MSLTMLDIDIRRINGAPDRRGLTGRSLCTRVIIYRQRVYHRQYRPVPAWALPLPNSLFLFSFPLYLLNIIKQCTTVVICSDTVQQTKAGFAGNHCAGWKKKMATCLVSTYRSTPMTINSRFPSLFIDTRTTLDPQCYKLSCNPGSSWLLSLFCFVSLHGN